jgi:hypothetical protein
MAEFLRPNDLPSDLQFAASLANFSGNEKRKLFSDGRRGFPEDEHEHFFFYFKIM